MLIYGFGSYFNSRKSYGDIDILIVHDAVSKESCLKAIHIKKIILKEIVGSSVTILSKSAEEDFDFIKVSGAIGLGVVDEKMDKPCINEIVQKTILFRQTYRFR